MHPSTLTLQECLAQSDVVVSAVPNAAYKVKTEWLKDGCVCINVAGDKNFEKDVREKASAHPAFLMPRSVIRTSSCCVSFCAVLRPRPAAVSDPTGTDLSSFTQASLYMPTMGKVTITMLLRNL